mgnify:CR=1 FL=1
MAHIFVLVVGVCEGGGDFGGVVCWGIWGFGDFEERRTRGEERRLRMTIYGICDWEDFNMNRSSYSMSTNTKKLSDRMNK